MSIDTSAKVPGTRPHPHFSSVLTGVLVATMLVAASAVSQVSADDNGTTSHLWDHFKRLAVAGTVNSDSNPVHWTKLKGVPAGLADGVDHGVTVAGFGLNEIWSTAFAVDSTEVQRRVTTTCPSGQAIRSISQAGTAVCAPVSQALSTDDSDTGIICNDWCNEGSLPLTPGAWVITAKIRVAQQLNDDETLWIMCRLRAGGELDVSTINVTGDLLTSATLPMQLMTTVASGASAYVDCLDHDQGDAVGRDLSIIAIRVGG